MNTLDAIITSHPFVSTMSSEHLDLLCKNAREIEYKRDQILFRQGDPANRMLLIEEGKIVIEAHEAGKTVPIQTFGTGDVLGWSWLFPPFSWLFQGRATEPTKVIALDGAHLLIAAEQDHDFGYELMKRVSQMLIHRVQTTRHQLIQKEQR